MLNTGMLCRVSDRHHRAYGALVGAENQVKVGYALMISAATLTESRHSRRPHPDDFDQIFRFGQDPLVAARSSPQQRSELYDGRLGFSSGNVLIYSGRIADVADIILVHLTAGLPP